MSATGAGTDPASYVWYVSYGSNLLAERFATYLEGGIPEGRLKGQRGARNPSRWTADRPLVIPHRLVFAGDAKVWGGGGVCFIDPAISTATTRCRAFRITLEQFQDVLAQESGRPEGTDVDVFRALPTGTARLGDGNYDTVIYLGETDGEPMFTFTSPRFAELVSNPPADSYRSVVVRGLVECHDDLDIADAEAYVSERVQDSRR